MLLVYFILKIDYMVNSTDMIKTYFSTLNCRPSSSILESLGDSGIKDIIFPSYVILQF
jgi:hypothetical protein